MNNSQLNNMIRFSLLFNEDMDINIKHTSPDYIREKWDRYIGVDNIITSNKSPKFLKVAEWKDTWCVGSFEYDNILLLIYELNDKFFLESFGLYGLIELYSSFIDIESINKEESRGGLHPLVEEIAQKWLNRKENTRLYKIIQLEN
jgi:hypothetical protein